jgi:hypothetical protein
MTDDVSFQGHLMGNIKLKDLAPIVPAFKDVSRSLNLEMAFMGQGNDVNIPLLSLSDEKYVNVGGHANILDWDAKQDMHLEANLSNLSVTKPGIHYYMNALTGSVPSILQRLEYIQFKGGIDGFMRNLQTKGVLQTAAGTINANLLITSDEDLKRTFSGKVLSKDLNLCQLLGDKKFGLVDFNIEVEGFNYQNEYPESYIKGVVSSFDYSDYRYENITLDGMYKDGGFNGHLALDDENVAIQVDGAFNMAQRISDFNIQASVKNFRPHALNLSDKYEDSDISLNLVADFSGSSIDDMNGVIRLDSLVMNTSGKQDYFLDNLSIMAGQSGGEKEIQILSPFLMVFYQNLI